MGDSPARGDRTVNFEMRFWIDDPANGVINVRSQVLVAIWAKFRANGIRLSLAHRDLFIKPESELTVRFESGSQPNFGSRPPGASRFAMSASGDRPDPVGGAGGADGPETLDQATLTPPGDAAERRYALRTVKQPQSGDVSRAHRGRCALSGLPEPNRSFLFRFAASRTQASACDTVSRL